MSSWLSQDGRNECTKCLKYCVCNAAKTGGVNSDDRHFAHVFHRPVIVVTSACHCGNGGREGAKKVSAEPQGEVAGTLALLMNSSFLLAMFLSFLFLHSTVLQE